jgi:catechol 2,3-dioxygenase-like lactoylglutathione lyase family enzyme
MPSGYFQRRRAFAKRLRRPALLDTEQTAEEVVVSTSVVNSSSTSAAHVDMKFEVVVIPVSDVGRAREFYKGMGWRLDADFDDGKGFHIVQFTPPGSSTSVIFGTNVTPAVPGSAQGLYLVVSDIEAARKELMSEGIDVSEVFHGNGVHTGKDQPYLFGQMRLSGPDPDHRSYQSFASFNDPDGNGWLMQEVTTRLPGRVVGETMYASVEDLCEAMKRAEAAHGEHEKKLGKRDENWAQWYAEYMVKEQSGADLPK